jgi:hypothetical protein
VADNRQLRFEQNVETAGLPGLMGAVLREPFPEWDDHSACSLPTELLAPKRPKLSKGTKLFFDVVTNCDGNTFVHFAPIFFDEARAVAEGICPLLQHTVGQ